MLKTKIVYYKFLGNARGGSLILAMFFILISSYLTVTFLNSWDTTKKDHVLSLKRPFHEMIYNIARSYLSNPIACSLNFSGRRLRKLSKMSIQSILSIGGDNNKLLEMGEMKNFSGLSIELDSMRLLLMEDPQEIEDGFYMGDFDFTLYFQTQRTVGNQYLYRIPIKAFFERSGARYTILSCRALDNDAVYGRRCTLGSYLVGFNEDGDPICRT